MIITPIKTDIMRPPQDDLFKLLDGYVKDFNNQELLVVTSKVVSLHQGRCLKMNQDKKAKTQLVKQEADRYIELKDTPNRKQALLTMKNGIVISQAGIDCSNADGYYILWPENPQQAAKEIYYYLRQKFNLTKLGVIITDTKSNPFRLGSIGFSLSHFGFKALNKYHGRQDLFKRKFKAQRVNVVDALSAAAVVAMGEGNEQTPLAKISDIDFVQFAEVGESPVASPQDDYYTGLIRDDLWHSKA